MESDQFLVTAKHPAAAMTAVVRASTPDDQSRTWDGRVLNSREAVLEFLAEIEEARRRGQDLRSEP